MFWISLWPAAQGAAISIAMPARMSGGASRSPRSRDGPVTMARCGSHSTMSAPIDTSLSVKIMRFSNIHSWTSTEPLHCVASATAIEVRSAGNAGHGPSWILALNSPTSRLVMRLWSPGTITSAPSSSVRRPSRSKTRRIIRRSSGSVSLIRSSPPVTPASAMNEPISMWSGPTSCVQPPSCSRPVMVRTFDPMPRMSAPIFTSIRARSWTCGSHAALPMTVVPGVRAAAMTAFSVAITDGSSMKTSPARRWPFGAVSMMSRSCTKLAPRARNASRCGSRRRRPMTSPPGGGMSAWPKRASSGPAGRNEARMRVACSRSMCASGAEAARMAGGPSLFPAGVTVQRGGTPPSMTNFSMRTGAARGGCGGSASLTAMSVRLSRDEAWSLLTEWVESESLRRHCLAVETAMRAYAKANGEDEELWGVVGLLHDMDYERHPDLETGHPRVALTELERMDVDPVVIRAIASHADFLGVSRDSPLEKTLYAVDELSGFLLACAYVRPEGIVGLTPKSVKKKLKQPSFAAAVNREEVRAGAEQLGVDFDEHVRAVIAALEEHASALGLEGEGASAPAG